ncbi:MAG: repeat-containing protein [Pedosphaera sp.]|nr:repeat-containing protein [Pedosphaera sp.]
MKRTHSRVVWAVVFVAIAGVVGWLGLRSREKEPVYQGKSLGFWLGQMEEWNGDTNEAACVAFRTMGTNAIPALLNVIQSGGPPMQKMIMELNQKQKLIDLPYGRPWERAMAATWALYVMGTNARPALPVLTNLFLHSNEMITTSTVLAGIGPEGIAPLLTALTNQNYRVRISAILGLGWARSDFETVVPALIDRLKDTTSIVQNVAVFSLGQLHAKPELAVPALMKSFSTNDTLVRSSIMIALGQFGATAREAVPMVVAALNDADELVRMNAGNALKQIDPEAAAKAGVK